MPEPTLSPELKAEILQPIGKAYPLPLDFEPSQLHTLVEYIAVRVTPGKEYMQGHPEAAKWVSRLFKTATEDGIVDMVIGSAYRSIATQTVLWERAGGENQSWVAPPGTSEHHSGLAFDFTTASINYRIDNEAGFEDTPAGRWLAENAHRFGFVNTYVRPGIDGVGAEPWHYRYATIPISTQLFENGYLEPDSTINPIEFYAGLRQAASEP
jgi:D-alanyl-D-alanine carboxypeptidase